MNWLSFHCLIHKSLWLFSSSVHYELSFVSQFDYKSTIDLQNSICNHYLFRQSTKNSLWIRQSTLNLLRELTINSLIAILFHNESIIRIANWQWIQCIWIREFSIKLIFVANSWIHYLLRQSIVDSLSINKLLYGKLLYGILYGNTFFASLFWIHYL